MSVRDIVTVGHPVLRERARELTLEEMASPETQAFIDDLVDTMRHANGAGLAANQVGVPIRIAAIEVGNNPRYPYKPKIPLTIVVNPIIEPIDKSNSPAMINSATAAAMMPSSAAKVRNVSEPCNE